MQVTSGSFAAADLELFIVPAPAFLSASLRTDAANTVGAEPVWWTWEAPAGPGEDDPFAADYSAAEAGRLAEL